MRTERLEALDIFRKWMDGSALLSCELNMPIAACSIRGRVVSVADEIVEIRSDDELSALVAPLRLAVSFAYEEPRKFPEEARDFESGMVVFFAGDEVKDPRRISFCELVK